jgi:hypothetical protein
MPIAFAMDQSPRFEVMNREIDRAIRETYNEQLELAVRYVKRNYFRKRGDPRPEIIVSRSGRLESTVRVNRAVNKGGQGLIIGGLKMGDSRTPQARILEYGGRTRPHTIAARRAPTLAFFWEKVGKWVFPKVVHHPGSVFEPRAVIGRGIAHRTPILIRAVRRRIVKEMKTVLKAMGSGGKVYGGIYGGR